MSESREAGADLLCQQELHWVGCMLRFASLVDWIVVDITVATPVRTGGQKYQQRQQVLRPQGKST